MSHQLNSSQSPQWHIKLRQILVSYFDENEIETLCFDLRVDCQSLTGTGKARRIIELINYFARSGRVVELIDYCSQQRPNIPWVELKAAAISNPLVVDHEPDEGVPDHQQIKLLSSNRPRLSYVAIVSITIAVLVGLVVLIMRVLPDNHTLPTQTSPTRTLSGSCLPGFVYRLAGPNDEVCVTSSSHKQAQDDNVAATSRRVEALYGPDTCKQGYVWREAFPGDHVCVIDEVHTQVQRDNNLAADRTVP